MRDGAPDEVLAGACTWQATVTSWLGARLLAERVPISSGRVTGDVGDEVIENLSITVPRFAAGDVGGDVVDWRPSSPDDPLARYGQILDVTITVSSVITGEVWETRIGRYQIKDWSDDDGGLITVKGESLLARPRDDKMKVLSSPTGTFSSEARRLLPAGMGASFDPALKDRPVPASMAWAKDRLKNLQDIAAAWPALLRIDPWGQVAYRAPLPVIPTPILTLRDGRGGTLIAAPRNDTRSGVYNEVIASTTNTETEDVQGTAAVTAGPMNANGDYGVVTKEWSSSLLENKQQAEAAAATMLANSTRPALAIPARIAPDPRIELDDPVAVLRGARGHMETVAAVYSEWTEELRNLAFGIPGTILASRVDDVPFGGSSWFQFTSTGVTGGMRHSVAGLVDGSSYTFVAEVANPGATPIVLDRISWSDLNITNVTLQPGERRTVTSSGSRATYAGFNFADVRAPNGTVFLLRLSTVALGAPPELFPFDGSSDPNGTLERTRWLGAAGASPSIFETRVLLTPEHRVWMVEAAEADDVVDRQWGWVTAYDLPLTVSDGDMRVDVGLPS